MPRAKLLDFPHSSLDDRSIVVDALGQREVRGRSWEKRY
jgi:hypothetical protein